MKFKGLLTSLFAGASLFSTSYVAPVVAGGCDDPGVPSAGTIFQWTGPGSWKIITTVRQDVVSANERKVTFAYKKADLKAQRELARWVNINVKNVNNLSEEEKEKFVVDGNGDMTEDSLEGFANFAEEYGTSTEALLVGTVEVGRCHTLGSEVRLSRGINSDTAYAAKMMSGQKFKNTNDETASEANKSTEAETVTKKTFRKDVNQGYSGYGNFNDF